MTCTWKLSSRVPSACESLWQCGSVHSGSTHGWLRWCSLVPQSFHQWLAVRDLLILGGCWTGACHLWYGGVPCDHWPPVLSLVTARINQFCGHPYSAYIEETRSVVSWLVPCILIVSRLVQVHTQLCACLSGAEVSYVVAYPHKLLLDESGNYLWMSGYVSSCSYLLGFLRSVAGTMDFSSSWADSCRWHGGHVLCALDGELWCCGATGCRPVQGLGHWCQSSRVWRFCYLSLRPSSACCRPSVLGHATVGWSWSVDMPWWLDGGWLQGADFLGRGFWSSHPLQCQVNCVHQSRLVGVSCSKLVEPLADFVWLPRQLKVNFLSEGLYTL